MVGLHKCVYTDIIPSDITYYISILLTCVVELLYINVRIYVLYIEKHKSYFEIGMFQGQFIIDNNLIVNILPMIARYRTIYFLYN